MSSQPSLALSLAFPLLPLPQTFIFKLACAAYRHEQPQHLRDPILPDRELGPVHIHLEHASFLLSFLGKDGSDSNSTVETLLSQIRDVKDRRDAFLKVLRTGPYYPAREASPQREGSTHTCAADGLLGSRSIPKTTRRNGVGTSIVPLS